MVINVLLIKLSSASYFYISIAKHLGFRFCWSLYCLIANTVHHIIKYFYQKFFYVCSKL